MALVAEDLRNTEQKDWQRDLKKQRALSLVPPAEDAKGTSAQNPGDSFAANQNTQGTPTTRPKFRSPLAAPGAETSAHNLSAGQQSIGRPMTQPQTPLQPLNYPSNNTNPANDNATVQTDYNRAPQNSLRQNAKSAITDQNEEQGPAQKNKSSKKSGGSSAASKQEDQQWQIIWYGVMASLTGSFFAGFFTIIIPILLLPVITFLYAFRLFAVNFANKSKPITFPILGIGSIKVAPLQYPFEVMVALAWTIGGSLMLLLMFVFIMYIMNIITSFCANFSIICKFIPGLQIPLM